MNKEKVFNSGIIVWMNRLIDCYGLVVIDIMTLFLLMRTLFSEPRLVFARATKSASLPYYRTIHILLDKL